MIFNAEIYKEMIFSILEKITRLKGSTGCRPTAQAWYNILVRFLKWLNGLKV